VTGTTLASLLLALAIDAAGDCPSGADVEQQLAPLLGDGAAAHAADVARITSAADRSVSVSLVDGAGRVIGDRTFPAARTCGDQAKTVAVTLAIWEAQLHPEITLRLDRLSAERAPPATEAPTTLVRAPPPPPPTPRARELSLGAAAVADWQADTWAPGVRVEVGIGPAQGRWRFRVGALGVGRHRLALPPGQVNWRRAVLQLGADVDVVRARRWTVSVGAGALGGVVALEGAGFGVDRQPRSVDLGAEARVRVEARLARLRPWLGVALAGWIRRQVLDVQGTGASSALPRLEPMAALGADFVW
jgi:hypothetical protein